MRFLLDESVDQRISGFLSRNGHEVTVGRSGIPDTQVLRLAVDENQVLITNDKDFGELVFKRGFSHSGVILFRLGDADLQEILERLRDVLDQFVETIGDFIVVTPSRIRSRQTQK